MYLRVDPAWRVSIPAFFCLNSTTSRHARGRQLVTIHHNWGQAVSQGFSGFDPDVCRAKNWGLAANAALEMKSTHAYTKLLSLLHTHTNYCFHEQVL